MGAMLAFVKEWPKTTLTSAVYMTLLLVLFVLPQNAALFLIWVHTPIYLLHEFEEYIFPGGFLAFFNTKVLGLEDPEIPLDVRRSFWINVPLIFVAYPVSAILATEFGVAWGIWTAYFSVANALSHVIMAFKFKYNPGLWVSLFVNIPVGAFTIWYFAAHQLISLNAHIIGLLIGLGAQAALMIYGFAILKPSIPLTLRVRGDRS
jgi:hypothetical protein